MSWSDAIDTAVGLSFVFLIASLVVSRINEYVATALQWRPKGLSQGLTELVGAPAPEPQKKSLLSGSTLATRLRSTTPTVTQSKQAGDALLSAKMIKEHALVRALDAMLQRNRRISYLPSETFATALLDILKTAPVPHDELIDAALAGIEAKFLSGAGQAALAALARGVTKQRVLALGAAIREGDADNRTAVDRLLALLDDVPDEVTRIDAGLAKITLDGNPAAAALVALFTASGGDVAVFGKRVEKWYDDAMDRLSGWYKRRVQLAVISYGAVLVIAFNIDAAGIAENLWTSPVERTAVATAAAAKAGGDLASIDESLSQVTSLSIPIGWDLSNKQASAATRERRIPDNVGLWIRKIIGMLLSVLAISLGAPFWFDALGRLANLRNTGKKPARA